MANVVQFTIKGLDRASGPLGKVSRTLGVAVKGIAALSSVAVTAGGGLAILTNKVTQAQDRIAKMSTRLGVATDKLSAFHFIAERGGVSTQNMNLSLQRMTRRVSEAAQGLGEAQGALKELNLSAVELNKLPIEEQMQTIASRLNQVGSQADRVRLAFKLFDSEGVGAVLQTLEDLGPNFDAVIKDFKFLGGEVTPQAAANAEEFQNQMTRVRTSLFGVGQAISNRLAPTMTGLANSFANFVARNRERFAQFVSTVITEALRFGVTLSTVFGRIKQAFTDLFAGKDFAEIFDTLLHNFLMTVGGMVDLVIQTAPAFAAAFTAIFKGVFEGILSLGKELWIKFFDLVNGTDVALTLGEAISNAVTTAVSSAKPVVSAALEDIGVEVELKSAEIGSAMGGIFDGVGAEVDAKVVQIKGAMAEMAEAANQSTEMIGQKTKEVWEGNRLVYFEISQATQDIIANTNQSILEQNEMFAESLVLRNEALQVFNEEQFAKMEEMSTQLNDSLTGAVENVGLATGDAILQGQNLAQALKASLAASLKAILKLFVQTQLKRLALAKTNIATVTSEAKTEGAKSIALTGSNTFASVSAAPWPISLTAPAVAAAHQAGAKAIFTAGNAIGRALGALVGGAAHGGLDFVPQESTFLLQRGERVLSPRQNRDLTSFIANEASGTGGSERSVSIGTLSVEVLPNASNLDALRDISVAELREELIYKIIEALDDVDRLGVRPAAVERLRGS